MGGSTQDTSRLPFETELGQNIQGLQGLAGQFGKLGQSPQQLALAKGGLTGAEQLSFDQAQQAITAGGLGAEQGIQQNVRQGAASRGLFESRGAIAQEASELANIPLFQAQQRAQLFGQQGQLQRQGLQQGFQNRFNILQGQRQTLGLAGQLSSAQIGQGKQGGIGRLVGGAAGAYFGGPAGAMAGGQLGAGL